MLLDHFQPPVSLKHKWRSLHGTWAVGVARLLNAGVLPPGYLAAPFLDHDGPVEVDVDTFREDGFDAVPTGPAYQPSAPTSTLAVAWPAADDIRVEIRTDHGDPELAAAIEFVSPRNKDRATAREAFAAKCAGLLARGCGVVVIDVVTIRRGDLHGRLLAALDIESPTPSPGPLSAISYRPLGGESDGQLQTWSEDLAIGRPLPEVPLWLAGSDRAVPLDLASSYAAACSDLGIRSAG